MRAVIQRVKKSSVTVDDIVIGSIGTGLLTLLGVADGDTLKDANYLADKISNLRIFEDDKGRMNKSLLETGGEMLVVSQFTLIGDCRKGRRPSFIKAGHPEMANKLYEYFAEQVKQAGVSVQTGQFGAMMDVKLINDGPVTFVLESK